MNLDEANSALRYVGWSDLVDAADGTEFGVIVNGEPVTAVKVSSENKEDSDYDRDLSVVVKVGEQFYRKTGYGAVGSHCYGDYEPSWNSGVTEVFPRETTVTLYETVVLPREATVTKYSSLR